MNRSIILEIVRHVLLAIGAVFTLMPVAIMIASAFTPTEDILAGKYLTKVTLANFITVSHQVPIGRYYLNSIIVCVSTFVMQLIVCIPAAYAMARLRYCGRKISIWIINILILVPFQVIAIPIYLMLQWVGLNNTLLSLVLPFIGSAFSIYLLRQFFITLPESMFDAAKIDGASTIRVLLEILIPSSRPAITTLGVFTVTSAWNAYFWPSFILSGQDVQTVPFGVVQYINSEAVTDYGPQMAMATLSVAPLLISFLLAQKSFIQGLAIGKE